MYKFKVLSLVPITQIPSSRLLELHNQGYYLEDVQGVKPNLMEEMLSFSRQMDYDSDRAISLCKKVFELAIEGQYDYIFLHPEFGFINSELTYAILRWESLRPYELSFKY